MSEIHEEARSKKGLNEDKKRTKRRVKLTKSKEKRIELKMKEKSERKRVREIEGLDERRKP